MMRQLTIYIKSGLWLGITVALLILSSCTSDTDQTPKKEGPSKIKVDEPDEEIDASEKAIHPQDSVSHIFSVPGAKVKQISIETRSGDNVDFIRRDSNWVNKDNLTMNAKYAQEMVKALNGVSFTKVKPSQDATARVALKAKDLRVTVDWVDSSQKIFYLVTSFSTSPKTFVCFSSDTTMKGPLYEAWINQESKGVTQDFTSSFDPSLAEFGAESMRDRSILSMANPLKQIKSINVVFYGASGMPSDSSYVLDWERKKLNVSNDKLFLDTLKARSYINNFKSIKVQRHHTSYKYKERVRANDKLVSLTVHTVSEAEWVLHVYRMPCTPSLGCPEGDYVKDQYFGEVEGQPSWFELQDFAFHRPMVKPASFFLP